MVLAPIFLGFFITHAFLIVYGVNAHAGALSGVVQATWHETLQLSKESGWMFTVALFLRAYSVGAGTYTGIEAVSNNVNMLAEPRVRTGHWRSEERRVGQACVSTCRSRGSPSH